MIFYFISCHLFNFILLFITFSYMLFIAFDKDLEWFFTSLSVVIFFVSVLNLISLPH